MKVTKVNLIWESEFSQLVEDTYGRPYKLQQQGDMLHQESMVRLSVPGEVFDHWQATTLEEWVAAEYPSPKFDYDFQWEREFYPQLEEVANDLHERGLLDEGEYVLHVWW